MTAPFGQTKEKEIHLLLASVSNPRPAKDMKRASRSTWTADAPLATHSCFQSTSGRPVEIQLTLRWFAKPSIRTDEPRGPEILANPTKNTFTEKGPSRRGDQKFCCADQGQHLRAVLAPFAAFCTICESRTSSSHYLHLKSTIHHCTIERRLLR